MQVGGIDRRFALAIQKKEQKMRFSFLPWIFPEYGIEFLKEK